MSTKDEKSEHGRALAELGAAKGGRARAKALTPEERQEIARYAAQQRWGDRAGIPRATHGDPSRPLRIGELEIPCYVLEDGRRVLAQRGMLSSLGIARGGSSGTGGDRLAKFVRGKNLSSFVSVQLADVTGNPMRFITPRGAIAFGYEATVLADICEAVLKARDARVLQKQQEPIAKQCEILMRAFAKVGIIALVDEATGYQADRARDALARILEQFIAKDIRKWVKTFPADFYQEMFRLRGWKYADDSLARPQVVGNYTNDIIYKRLAPGVLGELRRLTLRDDKGRLKTHFHRRLTEDVGHPKLREHLASVITIMKLSQAWDSFMQKLDRIHPRWDRTLSIPFPEADEA